MNLNAPPRLTGIKTKKGASVLRSIQLVFEGGIESPVFDAGDDGRHNNPVDHYATKGIAIR